MSPDTPRKWEATGRPLGNRDLADRLCTVSEALSDARSAHVAKFDTFVPHAFMGDVLEHVGRCLGRGNSEDLGPILDTLEQGFARGDRETRSVIAISFAADARPQTFFRQLYPLLGARLRNTLQ